MRANAHIVAATSAGIITSLTLQPITLSRATDYQANNSIGTHQIASTTEKQPDTTEKQLEAKKKTVKVEVKPGDSLVNIAEEHDTTWIRMFNANKSIDDPSIIHPGQKLIVPAKGEKLPGRYKKLSEGQIAIMPSVQAQGPKSTAGNSYYVGTCTWYVKNMRSDIPNSWGNASEWYASAQADGYSVGSQPKVGAIAWTSGHVAYVAGVNGNNVTIKEMNYAGVAGVNTRTVHKSQFLYIY